MATAMKCSSGAKKASPKTSPNPALIHKPRP